MAGQPMPLSSSMCNVSIPETVLLHCPRLASNLPIPCLSLQSAEITDVSHHSKHNLFNNKPYFYLTFICFKMFPMKPFISCSQSFAL